MTADDADERGFDDWAIPGRQRSYRFGAAEIPQNVVLDIDETMVHTTWDQHHLIDLVNSDPTRPDVRERLYILEETRNRPKQQGDFDGNFAWGSNRPHLRDFLNYACDRFANVIVWTAGTKSYAEAIVSRLFEGLPPPHRVYSRKHCHMHEGYYVKPLETILDPANNIGLHNTFVIDDNRRYVKWNENNAIVIPRYEPESLPQLYACDPALPFLQSWFERASVRQAPDVRLLDKRGIFNR